MRVVVVENAGQDNETVVIGFPSWSDAHSFITSAYSPDKRLSLGVDILWVRPDGTLTTDPTS